MADNKNTQVKGLKTLTVINYVIRRSFYQYSLQKKILYNSNKTDISNRIRDTYSS